MTDLPLSPAEEADALAAEYVLGVLDLPERMAVEQRMKTDAALRAAVEAWEDRLAPLSEDYAEVPAPDHLKAIEARLFPDPPRSARRAGLWGWLSGAAAAAVLGVAVLLVLPPAPPEAPPVIASLAAADALGVAFEVHHDGRALILRQTAGAAADADHSYEVWAIAPGAAPVSLGLAGADPIPAPRPPAGWTLAVSLEPLGGSPSGAPTGPVIAAGEVGV